MSILDAALGYTESSPQWPIIPIAPSAKRPYIATGRDHAEHASTDPDVIAGWLRRWPDMEIGTPTGWPSGTVVIDVDPPDGEALLAVLEREDVLGALPRERVSRSPRGGLHIVCARPAIDARVPSSAGPTSQLGRLIGGRGGIDVRADGGLIVLPPSRGRTWIADDDGPLPVLPARWLAAIMRAGDPPPVVRAVSTTRSPDRERQVRRARAYIDRIAPTTMRSRGGAGGGQAAIWQAACRAMHGYGLHDEDVRQLVAEWCARCVPPWSEDEIEHTIRSARAHVRAPEAWRVEDRMPT